MTDPERFAFPEPLDEEPRRFTPLLAVAAVIGALALVVIAYLLFFSGGGTRPPTSPGPGSSVPAGSTPNGTPTSTLGPGASPGISPSAVPSAAAVDLAGSICAEPLAPFDGLRPSLIEGFREYCVESVVAVLTLESIDPLQVSAAGWAFTGGAAEAEAEGAPVSRVFLTVADERRARRYLVSHTDGDATIAAGPDRVRVIADDLLIFGWMSDAT